MRPNLVAENAALSACEKARRWQHAFALFRELPRKRLKADKISCFDCFGNLLVARVLVQHSWCCKAHCIADLISTQ